MVAHQPSPTLAMGCTRPNQESRTGGARVYQWWDQAVLHRQLLGDDESSYER